MFDILSGCASRFCSEPCSFHLSLSDSDEYTSLIRSLWALAALKLSEKDRASLGCLEGTPQLDEILSAVISREQECIEKQWVIKRGSNNGALVLRDVFKKIAIWVQKFVEVGDVAVQCDPSHAALPWAAVRFILLVHLFPRH